MSMSLLEFILANSTEVSVGEVLPVNEFLNNKIWNLYLKTYK
jgi:hypothetical protein